MCNEKYAGDITDSIIIKGPTKSQKVYDILLLVS